MAAERTFVIVGAALAGARAAEALRDQGFDGRVVLVGAESVRPYERPPLSKDYLRGEGGREKVWVHEAEDFYAQHDIELLLGRTAASLDAGAHELTLDGGETLRSDRLLLTTGAEPRRLRVPGSDLDGVLYLRSVEDSDAIRERIDRGGRMVVVGAGWIGTEVAASARQRGMEVTILDPLSVPLERVLGREVGVVFHHLHADHGVDVMCGTGVDGFEGSGSVERVRTSDGRTVDCDVAVVGIGVAPRVELAQAAGLDVDDGILVDALLRTSDPDVFAAGDVARAQHPLFAEPIRVEHWANALNQGPAAARSMLDAGEPYARVPYFFSDQFDLGMEYSGYATSWDRVVFRGDVPGREFMAFWMSGDRVLAGMNVNVWDVTEEVQRLIRDRIRLDDARLADPDVPLADL